MSNRRFIVLDIEADYPLKNVKPHIFYRLTLNGEERRCYHFFVVNGNIYFKVILYGKNDIQDYYCCSIEKLKKFIMRANISQFFKCGKKTELETVDNLCIMLMECGYKREIDFHEIYEAKKNLRSDFSKWHKYDDFHFISKKLNPNANPGDAEMGNTPFGSTITLDMISDRRKQKVPDCIKEEIIYWTNTMINEKLVDIESVQFTLCAEIAFEVIGTLFKKYKVTIAMVDKNGNQLHKSRFCLCDCGKEQENAMEEYFKNELFSERIFCQC